jgi:hypothetical protein
VHALLSHEGNFLDRYLIQLKRGVRRLQPVSKGFEKAVKSIFIMQVNLQVTNAMVPSASKHAVTGLTSVGCGIYWQNHAKVLARQDTQEDLASLGDRSCSNATFAPIPEIGAPEDVVQPGIEDSELLVEPHQQRPWLAPSHTEKLLEAWFPG